jgi:hypothetical protein
VPEDRNNHLKGPGLGSWRGHMNAIHEYATPCKLESAVALLCIV